METGHGNAQSNGNVVPPAGSSGNTFAPGATIGGLTFGQKAVGLTFNPSGDPIVNKIKTLYAEIIDVLSDGNLNNGATGLKGRILGRAINDAMGAQMWAVKAVTFKD